MTTRAVEIRRVLIDIQAYVQSVRTGSGCLLEMRLRYFQHYSARGDSRHIERLFSNYSAVSFKLGALLVKYRAVARSVSQGVLVID